MKAKQKGFIGDICDSESWQLHYSVACWKHLSNSVTHGCMRNIKELGEKKKIPAVASFFTILSSLSANWTFGFLRLE